MPEVLIILLCVGFSASLMGSFLVVTDQSPLADALSHSVLLGIVLAFFLVKDLDSPILILGALLFALVTVFAIEGLSQLGLAYDAATGLIFSAFFALAVLLISLFARNVHLDMDMVLMGEVLFAPFERLTILGWSLPLALVKSGLVLFLVVVFIVVFYRRLGLYLFDQVGAKLVGVKTSVLRTFLMALTGLTIVVSFDVVGVVSVLSFLIAPAMTSLLLARHFREFLLFSLAVGGLMAVLGYYLAIGMDLSVSASCSLIGFVLFLATLLVKVLRA